MQANAGPHLGIQQRAQVHVGLDAHLLVARRLRCTRTRPVMQESFPCRVAGPCLDCAVCMQTLSPGALQTGQGAP